MRIRMVSLEWKRCSWMGNKIARTTQVSASEYYLHELPSTYNLVLKEVLGRGRFFKSIQCKHDEGLVLVKVYFKRGDFLDLSDYERRLSQIKHIFTSIDHPHVWPFQVFNYNSVSFSSLALRCKITFDQNPLLLLSFCFYPFNGSPWHWCGVYKSFVDE